MGSSRAFGPGGSPFGSADLQANARRFFERALVISALLHLSLAGTFRAASERAAAVSGSEPMGRAERVSTVRVFVPLAAPPRIASPGGPSADAKSGTIEPVGRSDLADLFSGSAGFSAVTAPIGRDRIDEPVPPRPGPEDPAEPPFAVAEVQPRAIFSPKPEYPEWAREAGVEGTVLLRVLVAKDGHVADVVVVKGVRGLDREAVRGIQRWLFRPGLAHGRPVEVWLKIPVVFWLE